MSIQTTLNISRENAISRLLLVANLVSSRDYLELESNSSEDAPAHIFVDDDDSQAIAQKLLNSDLSKWTNNMLENVLDKPFFRLSMFDNYIIVNE